MTNNDDLFEYDPLGTLEVLHEEYLANGVNPGGVTSIDGFDGIDTLNSSFYKLEDFNFSVNDSDNIVMQFVPTGTKTELISIEKIQLSDTEEITYSNLYQWILDPTQELPIKNSSGVFSRFKDHVLTIFDDISALESSSAQNASLSMQLNDFNSLDNNQAIFETII